MRLLHQFVAAISADRGGNEEDELRYITFRFVTFRFGFRFGWDGTGLEPGMDPAGKELGMEQ